MQWLPRAAKKNQFSVEIDQFRPRKVQFIAKKLYLVPRKTNEVKKSNFLPEKFYLSPKNQYSAKKFCLVPKKKSISVKKVKLK